MAAASMTFKTKCGTVHLSASPTKLDPFGHDGIYVERVDVLPLRELPARIVLAAAVRYIVRLSCSVA